MSKLARARKNVNKRRYIESDEYLCPRRNVAWLRRCRSLSVTPFFIRGAGGGGGGGAIFHQSIFEWSISRSVSSKLVHLFVFGTIFPMMSLFISRHDRVRCRADRATWITTDRYWERKHSRGTGTYVFLKYSVLPVLCKFRRQSQESTVTLSKRHATESGKRVRESGRQDRRMLIYLDNRQYLHPTTSLSFNISVCLCLTRCYFAK